jgi:hypothetical protein
MEKGSIMATVVYVNEEFKRMPRADMAKIQRLITTGKFGTHSVMYKEKKINIEIKNAGTKITVKIVKETVS